MSSFFLPCHQRSLPLRLLTPVDALQVCHYQQHNLITSYPPSMSWLGLNYARQNAVTGDGLGLNPTPELSPTSDRMLSENTSFLFIATAIVQS